MSSRFYQFANFRLDVDGRRLLREDREVTLTPKAFAILVELVKSKGRLLERDELIKRVWPDSFVEEGNLKVTIFNLRRALEEDPRTPTLIKTVPRLGYRFAAEVLEVEDPEENDCERRSADQAYEPKVRSMAILPFKVMGGVDEEYLGLGLADALIVRLSSVRDIVIRPTSAVRKYLDSDESALSVARQLDVEAVLEGHIYRAGDRVRVTTQLISVGAATPLWADKFDERLTDIFDVEDSISEQVAQALTLTLGGHDKKGLARHDTDNFEAYRLYLKGRYHWAKRLSAGTRIAAEQFRAAIDLDPNYTRAYAGLADCYTQLGWLRILPPNQVFPVAKAAALRALELDSSLAEAHASLAWINLLYDLDYEAAEEGFNRSFELNPNYSVAHTWYGVLLIAAGRFSDALREVNKALDLDPLSPIINAIDGWPFYFMRNYEHAVDCYQKAIELEPKSFPAHYLLAATYGQMDQGDKAVAEMQIVRGLDESSMTLSGLAEAHAVAGQESEARAVLADIDRMARDGLYVSPYDLAGVCVRLGDYEEAVKLIEKTVEDKSAWRIFLPVDPKFDELRKDQRFAELVRQVRP